MSKIYLASHPAGRFYNDFFHLSSSPITCPKCGERVDPVKTPLEYYWEDEFRPVEQWPERQAFWGNFLLVVSEILREPLDRLAAFEFFTTRPVKTKLSGRKYSVQYLEQPDVPLYWARPVSSVDARVSGEPNEVCLECGCFTGIRQLTRLLVNVNDLPPSGVFSVKQNRAPQVFVTEEAKERLLSCGVTTKFFSGGRLE
jgi:hypothetical protein